MVSPRIAVLTALLAACSTAPDALTASSSSGRPADPPDPKVSGDTMSTEPSYVTEYANGGRNSRVGVSPRSLSQPAPVAETRALPEAILVSPDAKYVVVRYRESVDRIDRGGAVVRSFATNPSGGRYLALATDNALVFGGYVHPWDGAPPTSTYPPAIDQNGHDLAVRLQDSAFATVAQNWATLQTSERLVVQASNRAEGGYRWGQSFPGVGTGAIAADGSIGIALQTGRFAVLSAKGNADGHGAFLADVSLGEPFYLLSAMPGGFVALSAHDLVGTDTSDPSEVPMRGVWAASHAFKRRWSTGVHAIDPSGRVVFHAEVPFEGLQPPVDAGGGRVVIAGRGVAAIESGKVIWQSASVTTVRATAYADGTLAMTVGSELRIVDRGGQLRQSLRTPDDEPIVTAPAIGPDGAVWLGTAKRVWVAR